jgi:hypothetical protein
MKHKLIEKDSKRYIEVDASEVRISNEKDVLDLISVCWENSTYLMIIHQEALSQDFFNLRTGLAGTMLQKFMNYNIKSALVITNEDVIRGRFGEMVIESNKGNYFRVFKNTGDAEKWILSI